MSPSKPSRLGQTNRGITRWLLPALVLLAVAMVAACSGGGGDDEGDGGGEEPGQPTATAPGLPAATPVAPVASTAAPAPAPGATPSAPSRPAPTVASAAPSAPPGAAPGLPRIINSVEVVYDDIAAGRPAFEFASEPTYGSNPKAWMEPLVPGQDFAETVKSNIAWLKQEGYGVVEIYVVGGYGELFLDSQVLGPKVHPGFDYDSQYSGDELKVPEEDAKQRYLVVPDVFPTVVREAHAAGLLVDANIESLAHIINKAAGSGIGGGSDELVIAGNLPAPTLQETLRFVDEVIAAGADSIAAEAFSPEYDEAIAAHLATLGVPYWHTGPDLGSVWVGYYYSPYPDHPNGVAVYRFEHTIDSMFGSTNGTIFARARAMDPQPETAVVVGAYNPVPCDPSISIGELYAANRPGDALPVDADHPSLADGTPVENCATGNWRNLLLAAARREGVDTLILTSDLDASIATSMEPGYGRSVLDRIAAHPAPPIAEQGLPIANIIIDLPEWGPEEGYATDEFFEHVSLTLAGSIDDALSAAGYLTVLTYDHPWQGDVALTYIVTAGGNENTGEGAGVGPPHWTAAQGLPQELADLLDPARHPGPVFIQPVYGIPEGYNWPEIRARFGLPPRFSYANPALSSSEEYHTSLLTSMLVTSDADTPDGSPRVAVTPDTGEVLGHIVHLTPRGDVTDLGQTANYVPPGDVPAERVFASGPLIVPTSETSSEERTAPYLLSDGEGRFLWTIGHLDHHAFTYIVGQAIASATGAPAVLAEPAAAHVWSGRQTFAIAYEDTDLVLNLPFQPGQPIDITVYDGRSELASEQRGVAYQAPLRMPLQRYSMLVVEPAR